MATRPNYGIDSPFIVLAEIFLSAISFAFAFLLFRHSLWRWIGLIAGTYLLVSACGMLFYSRAGKLGFGSAF